VETSRNSIVMDAATTFLVALAYMVGVTAFPDYGQNEFVQCWVLQTPSYWERQAECGWKPEGRFVEPYVRYNQTVFYSTSKLPTDYREEARNAIAWWRFVAFGLYFEEVETCQEKCIEFRLEPLPSGTLGVGYLPCSEEPKAGDVVLNSKVDWRARRGWLELVLKHEVGHALGLGHAYDGRSIMSPVLHDAPNVLTLGDQRALSEMYNVAVKPFLPTLTGRP